MNNCGRKIAGIASLLLLLFCVLFVSLDSLIDGNPIQADGVQNLLIGKNLVNHYTFSLENSDCPAPDMFREPVWPAITGTVIHALSLESIPVDLLSTSYSHVFKFINVIIYSLTIYISSLYILLKTRKIKFIFIFIVLSLAIYETTPRLINNYNNESLATLLTVVCSILLHETINAKLNYINKLPVLLGVSFGLLALTKSQFLFISIPVFFVLFCVDRKRAIMVTVSSIIVLTPWMYRNFSSFNKFSISDRGKIVAAIRTIMTSESTTQEHWCMAFAFTHPAWQGALGSILDINKSDFSQGGKCQKLNRETCFDMGTVKVECAPFPIDISESNWDSKIQYFYKGYLAGQMIESNTLKFNEIFVFNSEFVKKYFNTLPLFAWRGFGFSNYPSLSIILSLSIFALAFTRYWPLALLCISSQLFHILLTHNIPRYHAIEIPVQVLSVTFLLFLISRKSLNVEPVGKV